MSEAATVPFAALAVVLAVAGGFKVVQPAPTVGAMTGLRLPSSSALVRLLGAAEVAVGVVALVVSPAATGWVVAAFYAAFSVFVGVALRSGTYLQTCGCFGGLEVPPAPIHLAVDGVAVVLAVVAAASGTPSLVSALGAEPIGGVLLLGVTGVAAGMVVALLTVLPLAGSARGRPPAPG